MVMKTSKEVEREDEYEETVRRPKTRVQGSRLRTSRAYILTDLKLDLWPPRERRNYFLLNSRKTRKYEL